MILGKVHYWEVKKGDMVAYPMSKKVLEEYLRDGWVLVGEGDTELVHYEIYA